MTPKQKATELVTYNGLISATNTAEQILKLAGLPQFQIVFWREVLQELKTYE